VSASQNAADNFSRSSLTVVEILRTIPTITIDFPDKGL
jgi:hypothetical protein